MIEDTQRAGARRLCAGPACYAAAVFALARVGGALAPGPGGVATFWPASGLALGVLLCVPRRRWPAYLAAGTLPVAVFNVAAGQSPALAAVFTLGNVLEPALGAWLADALDRGRRPRTFEARTLAGLLAGGGVATGLMAALPALALEGLRPGFAATWLRIWLGAALGVLAVAPLVLAWCGHRLGRPAPRRLAEAAALAVLVGAVGWTVFLGGAQLSFGPALFPPLLVWAATRFGARGATLACAAMTTLALGGTAAGRGFFSTEVSVLGAPASAQAFSALAHLAVLWLTVVSEARGQAVEALRRSQRELQLVRAATDAAHDALLCVDAGGRIVYSNDAARRALAGGADDLVALARPGGGPEVREVHVRAEGAAAVPWELAVSRVTFDGREYAVAAARDLRERKQAEEALRLATVGTLAAGIAHEINNPLAAMLVNVEFAVEELREARGSTAALAEAVERVEPALAESMEAGRRARDIVRDLRVFSRRDDRAEPEVADVARALRSALALARHELRGCADLSEEIEATPPVRGSERRLGQVFLNLLVNAAHAVSHEDARDRRVRVSARLEAAEVVAEVEDGGCGMPPEVLARVFEPFFTTKGPGLGTGLGLSICHGIVAGIGGRIEVESRPGQGSRFRVRLPVA